VEHHFNAATSSKANYTLVVVGSNASKKSKDWGQYYAKLVSERFETVNNGLLVGGYHGRGDANIKKTKMPAILVEPLFVSNPEQARIVKSLAGQQALAAILSESIMYMFPKGGRVAFSIGHKYKKSRPKDRGAAVYGGGVEADYSEKVLKLAEILLSSV
jgi:N-acetylmuramoyl-L-alanine amidase